MMLAKVFLVERDEDNNGYAVTKKSLHDCV